MDGCYGGSERHRVGFVGVAVREVVVDEEVGDFLRSGAEAERHIGRGDALGCDEDVGLDVPVVDGKPLAGATPAGHDFVGDQEHAVLVADFADLREVLVGWDEDAVGADDGLHDDGGDVGLVADHVLDVVSAGDAALRVGVLDGAAEAVDLRPEDDAWAFATGLHRPATRITRRSDATGGRAMVAAVARDDLRFARVHAGDLKGCLVGLGAGGVKKNLLKPSGRTSSRSFDSSARVAVA